IPTLPGGSAAEPAEPPGRCSAQRDKFVIGPGPDAGGSYQGKAGWVQTCEKSGIDAPPLLLSPSASTTDGTINVAADSATAVTAANKRKSRCVRIGHLRSRAWYRRLTRTSIFQSLALGSSGAG